MDLSYIAEKLRPLAVPIDDVHLDLANARTGHAVDRIAASLAKYGQRKPIVANRLQGGKIEAGNGTWQAAKALGWQYIAVVDVDDDPATAAGFGIADNRTGELSTWDTEMLLAAVETAGDGYTGFFEHELEELLDKLDQTELGEPASLARGLGDQKAMIKAVLYADTVDVFERAIKATGMTNRAGAVIAICRAYLERNGSEGQAEGQFDALLKSIAQA